MYVYSLRLDDIIFLGCFVVFFCYGVSFSLNGMSNMQILYADLFANK